ncbi:unnamed protein product [Urochloa humidicola]
MDSSSPLAVAAAPDSVAPESMVAAPDSIAQDSFDLVPDSIAQDSFDLVPDLESVEPAMEFTPELELDPPESEELLAPDSIAQDLFDLVPDSEAVETAMETTVSNSLPPDAFLCPRCNLVHEDRESWNCAHSWLYPCLRCGLVHMDYWFSSSLRYDEFDCNGALAVKHEMEEAERSWRNKNNK